MKLGQSYAGVGSSFVGRVGWLRVVVFVLYLCAELILNLHANI